MASSGDTLMTDVTAGNATPSVQHFRLLDLPAELPLKVYEELVTFRYHLYARELMAVRRFKERTGFYDDEDEDNEDDGLSGQPAITKVSRGVRRDALALYYSRNVFLMDYNVTERSCIVPFTRYPTAASTEPLRCLRTIRCLTKLQDRCPTSASPRPTWDCSFGLFLRISRSKTLLTVRFLDPEIYDTETRRDYLAVTVINAVGRPDDTGFDGLYLLKCAVWLHEGVICNDARPRWRDLDREAEEADDSVPAPAAAQHQNVTAPTTTLQQIPSTYPLQNHVPPHPWSHPANQTYIAPVFGQSYPGFPLQGHGTPGDLSSHNHPGPQLPGHNHPGQNTAIGPVGNLPTPALAQPNVPDAPHWGMTEANQSASPFPGQEPTHPPARDQH